MATSGICLLWPRQALFDSLLAVDNLQIAQRSQKRSSAAIGFRPSGAARKSQCRKEAGQAVMGRGAARETKEGNPLNHALILSCEGTGDGNGYAERRGRGGGANWWLRTKADGG